MPTDKAQQRQLIPVAKLIRASSKAAGIAGNEQEHPASSVRLPFKSPLDDAGTLMLAILTNICRTQNRPKSPQLPKRRFQQLDRRQSPVKPRLSLEIKEQFQSCFTENASGHNAFHSLMKKGFGESCDYSKAENIRDRTLSGDLSWMPEIKLLDGATVTGTFGQQGGAAGLALTAKTVIFYLSRDLLVSDPAKAEEILTAEVGHPLDARINSTGTTGDEGNIFRRRGGYEMQKAVGR